MNDLLVSNLERTVNVLLRRLAAVEAQLARVSQMQWQVQTPLSGGSSGSIITFANGSGVPAKASGVLGSATYNLYNLDASTGTLVSTFSATVWNDALTAVGAGDVIVATDPNGNYIVITEFC